MYLSFIGFPHRCLAYLRVDSALQRGQGEAPAQLHQEPVHHSVRLPYKNRTFKGTVSPEILNVIEWRYLLALSYTARHGQDRHVKQP